MRFDLVLFWFSVLASGAFGQTCELPTDQAFRCGSSEFQACAIIVNETERLYCQHLPNQGGRLPMVMAFHGAGGNAKALVNLFRGQTEQSMAIIVPHARETRFMNDCSVRWRQIGAPAKNWGDLNRPDTCAGGTARDDLEFVEALMDKFNTERDVQAYYALGFSNGGGFVYQLYMTQQLGRRFKGFAAAGAGMIGDKLAAMSDKASIYGPNQNHRRPFLFQIGTEDKKNIAVEAIADAVDNNPACQPITSAAQVMQCFYFTHIDVQGGVYNTPTRRSLTRDWLVTFNNADPRRHEGMYPNLGLGEEPSDKTITVREDYMERLGENSAAVSVLTTLDGGHDWPGWGGNRAPCPSRNCDVDLLHEVVQFWRAHGGMKLPVP